MLMASNPRNLTGILLGLVAATVLHGSVLHGQNSLFVGRGGSDEGSPWAPSVQVTDPRLGEALAFLAEASFTAAEALADLRESRLPVTIGTREQLAELSERAGGMRSEEREKLLAMPTPTAEESGAAMAWVMFRTMSTEEEDDPERVVHVWLAIEADTVESWIRQAGGSDVDRRIHQDFLAILAHEFVAHIGSIAESRRMEDLCDDPTAEQRSRSAEALARGDPEPVDGDASACALRVENRVREEINDVLSVRGIPLLPVRVNYSLEALHFEQARRRLFPEPAQRLRRLAPIRS